MDERPATRMNDRARDHRDAVESPVEALFARAGDVDRCIERLRQPFRSLVDRGGSLPPVVLFGAGAWGRFTADRLRHAGMPAIAFADNAERSRGTTVAGLPVLSPAEAAGRHGRTALFVTTIYNGTAARDQLDALGCTRVLHAVSFYYGLPELFIPYYQLDWPHWAFEAREEIERVHRRWHDRTSRRVFERRLAASLGFAPDPDEPVGAARDCYFDPALLTIGPADHVVDCGAFDGDTIRHLLRTTNDLPARITALEPDPRNAQALRSFVAALDTGISDRIDVVEAAASAVDGEIAFDASGTVGAQAGSGALRVKTVALDRLAAPGGAAPAPTYVKMDVEGHELDALRGAATLLRDEAPVLAISLYHRADDLWRIPRFIGEANGEYRLFLRCYAEDGWESVCYAIPTSRLSTAEVAQ